MGVFEERVARPSLYQLRVNNFSVFSTEKAYPGQKKVESKWLFIKSAPTRVFKLASGHTGSVFECGSDPLQTSQLAGLLIGVLA